MLSGQPSHTPVSANSGCLATSGFSLRPTVAAFSGRGFDMLRLINPPPLAANLSQVFMLLYALHVTYCRSQDYRPPFPQQGMNQSLLERHISSPTTAASPQLIPAHKFSPRVPAEVTNPCWGSPIPSSPVTFHQHMLRLSPSPLIVKNTSSPFLVQPIARQVPFHHQYTSGAQVYFLANKPLQQETLLGHSGSLI